MARGILTEIGNAGQVTRRYFQRTLPSDPTKDYYYVMRDTTNLQPVIVEYGFLDNPNDVVRLQKFWDVYAEAAVKAVIAYLGLPYTPPTAGKIIHVVVAGDTLFSIARKYNTTVDEIRRLNNLTSDVLRIGQQLIIPGTGVEEIPPSGNIVYVVRAGDTLFSIANRFNTTVAEIRRLNNLTSDVLSIGQQLLIPGVSIEEIPITHVVVAGDTLFSIANRYGTTVNEIMAANNLTSTTLRIGQVLTIPRPGTAATTTHVVVAGDTLFSIANRFNTTVAELQRLNNLTTTVLTIGQVLIVPLTGTGGTTTHVVVAGDTLFSIANRFNTTVAELRRLNNLTSDVLSIGQVLIVPRR